MGVESFRGFMLSLAYSCRIFRYALSHKDQFDLVFCVEPFFAIVGIIIARISGKPCVKDSAIVTRFHHLEMRTFRSRMTTAVSFLFEKTLFRLIDLTLVLCEADRLAYLKLGYKPERVAVVPLSSEVILTHDSVFIKRKLLKLTGNNQNTKLVFFTGGTRYAPNFRAVEWINRVLAPEISSRYPDARFVFTGSGPMPEAPHPAELFLGWVDDYFGNLCCADVVIIPLRPRSGVLVKMLDAMACSLATVTYPEVARGIPELKDQYNVMIADDEVQFIQKTLYLLEHPDYAACMGARAKETAQQFYSTDICRQQLDSILKKCVEARSAKT